MSKPTCIIVSFRPEIIINQCMNALHENEEHDKVMMLSLELAFNTQDRLDTILSKYVDIITPNMN